MSFGRFFLAIGSATAGGGVVGICEISREAIDYAPALALVSIALGLLSIAPARPV